MELPGLKAKGAHFSLAQTSSVTTEDSAHGSPPGTKATGARVICPPSSLLNKALEAREIQETH